MERISLGRVTGKSAYEVAVDNGYVGTESQWIDSLKGGNGTLVFENVEDLSTNLPFGSENPVWVISEKSWYYWNNSILDTAAPVLTITPTATFTTTQQVTMSANEATTIYYTLDGSTPTTSSLVYSTPLTLSATTVVKAFAKDTAGNLSSIQMLTYTKQAPSVTALRLSGTGYLKTPSVPHTRAVLNFKWRASGGQFDYVYDARPTLANSFSYITSNNVENRGNGFSTVSINGTPVTLPVDNTSAKTPVAIGDTLIIDFTHPIDTDGQTVLFAKNDGTFPIQIDLYDIKLYNGTSLVAHYDMTKGSLNDQSGNGNNGTLVGSGSWV